MKSSVNVTLSGKNQTVKILSIFVAFLENLNFTLATFLPLFDNFFCILDYFKIYLFALFLLPNSPKLTWFYPFLRFCEKDSAIVGISKTPQWRRVEAVLFGFVTKGMPNEQFVSIFLNIPYFLILFWILNFRKFE